VDLFGFGLKESLEFSFRVVIILKQMRVAIKKIAIKTIKMGQEEFSKIINIAFKTN
jgi:hypothetical protein